MCGKRFSRVLAGILCAVMILTNTGVPSEFDVYAAALPEGESETVEEESNSEVKEGEEEDTSVEQLPNMSDSGTVATEEFLSNT